MTKVTPEIIIDHFNTMRLSLIASNGLHCAGVKWYSEALEVMEKLTQPRFHDRVDTGLTMIVSFLEKWWASPSTVAIH